jgi:hypothetical protein
MSEPDYLISARQRISPHLARMVQRYAPNIDPDTAAGILFDPEHPDRDSLIDLLDDAIPKSASGHTPGIAESERNGWYSLGPGDQKVYAALRDSNLLNAVLNRQPVQSSRHLIGGGNYGVDRYWQPAQLPLPQSAWGKDTALSPVTQAQRLNDAVGYYEAAEADPSHHSNALTTYYPGQHSFWNVETNGDTAFGQVMSEMGAWPTGSMRASRRDEPQLLKNDQPDLPFMPNTAVRAAGDLVNHGYKWGKNIIGGLIDSHTHEGARTAVDRASVPVPEGLSPVRRAGYINSLRGLIEPSGAPELADYGHSKGVTYSDMETWLNDTAHEFVDPTSAASLGFGLFKGATGAGLKAVGGVVGREGWDEVTSPMNAISLMSLPEKTAASFKRPDADTIPEDAKETYAQQQVERDQALKDAAKLREQRKESSWLPRGAMIFPH